MYIIIKVHLKEYLIKPKKSSLICVNKYLCFVKIHRKNVNLKLNRYYIDMLHWTDFVNTAVQLFSKAAHFDWVT